MALKDFADHPKYSIIRCLREKNMNPDEVWRAYNIYPHEVALGKGVAAFVYRSNKGRVHMFINETLSHRRKVELLCHELGHIIEDLPKMGRIIGLDMQKNPFEIQADQFFYEVAAAYDGK